MGEPAGVAERALLDDHDDVVILEPATWADFQRVLELRGDRSRPRFAYLEGTLEIMSPSQKHEFVKSMLARLLETYCAESGVDITPYGSWTLERKEVERGVEPDECYVFGDDPEAATRPDLAIEVMLGRGRLNKLEIYRKLGVREVWVWRKDAIEVFVLRGEQYESSPASEFIPNIDFSTMLAFVEVRPMTRAVRAYRDALAYANR
jgi:Uma2 family endonuclease